MAAPSRVSQISRIGKLLKNALTNSAWQRSGVPKYQCHQHVASCTRLAGGWAPSLVRKGAVTGGPVREIPIKSPTWVNRGLLSSLSTSPDTSHPTCRGLRSSMDRTFESEMDSAPRCLAGDSRDEHAWMIRLANENAYLSWCRNAYIASVAGATIYSQEAIVPYSKEVGIVLIFMGGLNLMTGTTTYLYNVVSLRHTVLMSVASMFFILSMAIVNCMLWLGAMALYLGYIEEEDDEKSKSEKQDK